ncbi:MAG TPA: hypothetical protein VG328_07645 [Stellaceae bacterium]|nr:hypothetical protein [Stellaceae bacterium]
MRRMIAAAAVLFLAQMGTASAAGAFDGNWSGEVVGNGPSRACIGAVTGTVANNVLHGTMTIGKFAPSAVGGTIAPDGAYTSPGGRITGKFEGNSFTGSFSVPNGYCNPYKMTMKRSG